MNDLISGLVCVFVLVMSVFAFSYAKGIAEYTKNNRKRTKVEEKESMYKSFQDEKEELLEAVKLGSFCDIFLELWDVWHSFFKYVVVSSWLDVFAESPIFWFFAFFLVPVPGVKHGLRYMKTGCIRNHGNPNNLDHLH
jgi:hypothetical protein